MSKPTKRECIEKARKYLIPGRVRAYEELGVMPVLASAAGYRFRDADGREFQDFHLNGGTFNLGHRNPELLAVLERSLQAIGIGNHHFVSCSRADLAEALVESLAGLRYVVFTASGSEATDVAIKSARWATKRRKIVTLRYRVSRQKRPLGGGGRRHERQILLFRVARIPACTVR